MFIIEIASFSLQMMSVAYKKLLMVYTCQCVAFQSQRLGCEVHTASYHCSIYLLNWSKQLGIILWHQVSQ